jgi:regulator of protease activity HflC (stomatin/prohibitin superfamily)
MHITAAETNVKIPLDVVGVAEMQVENAHLAAFGTDRWDQAVINLVSDAITSETKQMTLDQALTAANAEEAKRINKAVLDIEADEIDTGIQINAFRILEINPVLDEVALRQIQSEALAKQVAKGTRVDGQARADVIREINRANIEGGDHSIATMEAEALVRAADAAGKGGGTVILTPPSKGGSSIDPTQAAILAELQKFNRNRK